LKDALQKSIVKDVKNFSKQLEANVSLSDNWGHTKY